MNQKLLKLARDPAFAMALGFVDVKVPCPACQWPIPDQTAEVWFTWADDIWMDPPAILLGGRHWAIRDDVLASVTSRLGRLPVAPTRFASFRQFGNGQTKPLLNYRGPTYQTVLTTKRIALGFPTYTGPKPYCTTCGCYAAEVLDEIGARCSPDLSLKPSLATITDAPIRKPFSIGGLKGLFAFEEFRAALQDLDLTGIRYRPVGSVSVEHNAED